MNVYIIKINTRVYACKQMYRLFHNPIEVFTHVTALYQPRNSFKRHVYKQRYITLEMFI